MKFPAHSLSTQEAQHFMELILSDETLPFEEVFTFLNTLRKRGETANELLGFIQALLKKTVFIPGLDSKSIMDTCGTGGDLSGTFNISTTSAFLLAGMGVRVAKHGNRSVSSLCGSADVLESLGVPTELSPLQVKESLDRHSFAFQLAPLFHPELKKIKALRKKMNGPSVFNLLGPLMNPARVRNQVLGIFDIRMMRPIAEVLREMGSENVTIVHGIETGLDEISLFGSTRRVKLKNGEITEDQITPEDAGVSSAALSTLVGGNAHENAQIITDILCGKERGPKRDCVILNAAAGFEVMGHAQSLRESVKLASESIDSGKAYQTLLNLSRIHRSDVSIGIRSGTGRSSKSSSHDDIALADFNLPIQL